MLAAAAAAPAEQYLQQRIDYTSRGTLPPQDLSLLAGAKVLDPSAEPNGISAPPSRASTPTSSAAAGSGGEVSSQSQSPASITHELTALDGSTTPQGSPVDKASVGAQTSFLQQTSKSSGQPSVAFEIKSSSSCDLLARPPTSALKKIFAYEGSDDEADSSLGESNPQQKSTVVETKTEATQKVVVTSTAVTPTKLHIVRQSTSSGGANWKPLNDASGSAVGKKRKVEQVEQRPSTSAPAPARSSVDVTPSVKTAKRKADTTPDVSVEKSNGAAALTSPIGPPPFKTRRRLLSERGENEACYPLLDSRFVPAWNWEGSAVLHPQRDRGAGLLNSSNDCFLNSVLQFVTHCPPLARYVLERHRTFCNTGKERCMCCALGEHIMESIGNKNRPNTLTPHWTRPHLRRIFPSHMHGTQEDAHELLCLLLDALDEHPGEKKKQPLSANNSTVTTKFEPKECTPIEQIFGSLLRNQVTCKECQTPFVNYERLRELNLGLKKDPKAAAEELPTSLSYLLDWYFRDETIQNFNCSKCTRKTEAVRKTRMLRSPQVLLVQLKRFDAFGHKIRLNVRPEADLSLSRHLWESTLGAATNGTPDGGEYILCGVVEHIGGGVDHGHYQAFVRGIRDVTAWHNFDDEQVCRVSQAQVQSRQPYLLMYRRREHVFGGYVESKVTSKNGNGHANGYEPKTPNGSATGQRVGGCQQQQSSPATSRIPYGPSPPPIFANGLGNNGWTNGNGGGTNGSSTNGCSTPNKPTNQQQFYGVQSAPPKIRKLEQIQQQYHQQSNGYQGKHKFHDERRYSMGNNIHNGQQRFSNFGGRPFQNGGGGGGGGGRPNGNGGSKLVNGGAGGNSGGRPLGLYASQPRYRQNYFR